MPAPAETKIIFFGNERLATGVTTTAPTLQTLIDTGYDVVAVVSHYERSKSRNARKLEIAAVAETHKIPLLLPEKPADIIDELQAYNATLGVLVAYGKIVPQRVIDVFPRGIVNIHPSLLPLHRGPTPLESVILEGATETGVSIMALAQAMDAGPVYDQTRLTLRGNETKQELADLLIGHGKNLLTEALPGIIDGSLPGQPQDDGQATYDALISKEDGEMDFSKPALQLEREIRAYAEWPKSRTTIAGKEVVVTAGHVLDPGAADNFGNYSNHKPTSEPFATADGKIGLPTADSILAVDMLKPAGKQEMTAAAFLTGYGHLL
jgi:methionyl-tRNA formyltransferase